MSFRNFVRFDPAAAFHGEPRGEALDCRRFRASLVAEAKRSAILAAVATSGINALHGEMKHSVPRYLTQYLPSPPSVFPVAHIVDRQLGGPTIDALRLMYENIEAAGRMLQTLIRRSEQGAIVSKADVFGLISLWGGVCDAAIDAIEALSRTGLDEGGNAADLRRMLANARAGGCPCMHEGRAVVPEWAQLRRHRRFLLNEQGVLFVDGVAHRVMVTDISKGGAGISGLNTPVASKKVLLRLHSGRELSCCVAWLREGRAGIRFLSELADNDPLICAGFD